jgi:hypothetical protein
MAAASVMQASAAKIDHFFDKLKRFSAGLNPTTGK